VPTLTSFVHLGIVASAAGDINGEWLDDVHSEWLQDGECRRVMWRVLSAMREHVVKRVKRGMYLASPRLALT
jgi:hypothetical protein